MAIKGGRMKKTIITVVGHDTVGIIAKVCTYLADNGINILDRPSFRGGLT